MLIQSMQSKELIHIVNTSLILQNQSDIRGNPLGER
jgi:hypothetical protein